jgi:hypothetical protein
MENNNNGWFALVLTLAFIVLKLTDQIDWSWWWVLSPLWLPLALVLSIAIIAIVFMALFGGFTR